MLLQLAAKLARALGLQLQLGGLLLGRALFLLQGLYELGMSLQLLLLIFNRLNHLLLLLTELRHLLLERLQFHLLCRELLLDLGVSLGLRLLRNAELLFKSLLRLLLLAQLLLDGLYLLKQFLVR